MKYIIHDKLRRMNLTRYDMHIQSYFRRQLWSTLILNAGSIYLERNMGHTCQLI